MLKSHNKELNFLHVKYNKEISNLEAKHTSEMNRINLELSETRKNIEIEKKIFEINLSRELRKNLTDAIQVDIREKFGKERNGQIDELVEKLRAYHQQEMKSLEDICIEELSRCQTESAISKVESVEKAKNKKDSEMEQLADFYRCLYETALRKFEERQVNLKKLEKFLISGVFYFEDLKPKILNSKLMKIRNFKYLASETFISKNKFFKKNMKPEA